MPPPSSIQGASASADTLASIKHLRLPSLTAGGAAALAASGKSFARSGGHEAHIIAPAYPSGPLGMSRSTSSLGGGTLAAPSVPLSSAALKLLNLGRTQTGYVHERRHVEHHRRNVGSTTRLSSQLLQPPEEEDAPDAPSQTFVESLNLPPAVLESLTRGDFVYCERASSDIDSNAYQLRVVDHKGVSSTDYCTVSQAGITHVSAQGEKRCCSTGTFPPTLSAQFMGADSEFTRLVQFEREHRLFLATRRIPFFAKYRMWKQFSQWKNHIRRGKLATSSQHLTDTLFLLNPTLRVALLRLRRLCSEAAEWGLFTCDRSRTYSLEAFVAQQNEKRIHVTTWLSEFSTDVSALVRSACDDVLDAFLAANGIHADHKMTFMERAALRTACRRLTKFVRLADFLVRDTLLGLALESTQQLLAFLTPPPAALPPRVVRTEMPRGSGEGGEAAGANAAHGTVAGSATAAARKAKGVAGPGVPMLVVSVSLEDPDEQAHREAGERGGRRRSDRRRSSAAAIAAAAAAAAAAEDPTAAGEPPAAPEPELFLTPALPAVRSALKSVLYDAMVVISTPVRLLNHADLIPYTRAASDDSTEEQVRRGAPSAMVRCSITFCSVAD